MKMRIYSATDDIFKLNFSYMKNSVNRIFHNDPFCRVCKNNNSGILLLSTPIPKPYPNPEREPKFQSKIQGGPHGTHWYHGTAWYPEDPNDDDDIENRLHSPSGTPYENYGDRREKHWNTDLGTHFSSIKDVAHEFASHGDRSYARIAHANLHMDNPKKYKNEDEFSRSAVRHALTQGKTFLPNSDEARKSYDNWDDIHNSPHFNNIGDERKNYLTESRDTIANGVVSKIDRYGPDAKYGPKSKYPGAPIASTDELESWLSHHPDRDEITTNFKNHLLSLGHDGVVYGNTYEGPLGHPSAIAFPETPIGIHHWEYLDPELHEQEKENTKKNKQVDKNKLF